MALKTIPELPELTTVDENLLVPVDSGIESHKMTSVNFAKGIRLLASPAPTAAKTTTYNLLASDAFAVILLDSSAGGFDINLPTPASFVNKFVDFKDVAGTLSQNAVNLVRNGGEQIAELANSYPLSADFGSWKLWSNGTNWFLL